MMKPFALQTPLNPRVIHLDDESFHLNIVHKLFRNLPLEVISTSLPRHAIKAITKSVHEGVSHLLISDINMPHQNGDQFVLEVRKHFPLIPVVFYSSDLIAATGAVQMVLNAASNRKDVIGITTAVEKKQLKQCKHVVQSFLLGKKKFFHQEKHIFS